MMPAMIRAGLSDHEARMLNFVENLERKDLNILEEARALARLYPEGVSLRVAAKELKRPTRWVHDRQRLLTLPEEVQQLAAAGLLGHVNVKVLARLRRRTSRSTPPARSWQAKREHGKTASLRHLEPEVPPQVRLPQVEGGDQPDGRQDARTRHHRTGAADGGLVCRATSATRKSRETLRKQL